MADYSSIISDSSPVLYLPLNDASNPTNELSGIGVSITTSSTFETKDFALGDNIFTGLKGSNPNALIEIGSFDEIKGSVFSIEFLMVDGGKSSEVIFERLPSNSNITIISIYANKLACMLGGANAEDFSSNLLSITPLNEAKHCLFIVDGHSSKAYINGKLLVNTSRSSDTQISQSDSMINLFSRNGAIGTTATLAHFAFYNRILSEDEIQARSDFIIPPIEIKPIIPFNIVWANKETREQANHQPSKVQTLTTNLAPKLLGKSGHYNSLMNQQGEQRKSGYYQSTVTVSNIPKPNTRVFCFTNDGQLLDETYSNESGVYRFDHLLMEKKYLFVAQYNNGNPKVAPDYLAASADWQSPIPYGS